MKLHPTLLLPLALLLCQCNPGPGPAKGEHDDRVDLVAPPPPPHGFVVDVQLSPAAKAQLDALGEKVEISAWYYGLPNAAGKKVIPPDSDGQFDLGNRDVVLNPGERNTLIRGDALDESKLKYIDGEPLVLVNVYTARKVAKDNLLDCGIFEDKVTKAQAAPIPIACKLIYPDPKQNNAQ